jgi:hypothetical protein
MPTPFSTASARPADQLELPLEELEASATEDEVTAGLAEPMC